MKTLLLVLAGAVAMVFARGWMNRPLDGTSWEVKTRADAVFALARRDTLIFKDGRLTSARWAGEGFAPGRYEASRGAADWEAVLRQEGKGTVSWQGVARDDRMEGTLQWTAEDGRTRRYRFKGARRL